MHMEDDEDDIFSDGDERQPVFTLHGAPIPIHLHSSLSSGGRNAMARKIEEAGGNPYVTEKEARVVICRYGTPIFTQLEFTYDHDRYKWVEAPSWVDTCIMLGKYEHHHLHGRTDKLDKRLNSRTPFTFEEDEHLAKFLASRIPFKDSGGRLGNGVYKDLCNPARASYYPWAARHPWQSWRDRYTKNQDIFDPRIAYAVWHDPDPPQPGGKGQYMIPRKTRKPQHLRYNVQDESEYDDKEYEEEEEEEGGVVIVGPIAKKRSRQESNLQDGRSEANRQSDSPPRKQPRIHLARWDAEDDASVGIGRDKGKGKGRQVPTESAYKRPENTESDDVSFPAIYDYNEPGPSQRYEGHVVAEVAATADSSQVVVRVPQDIASPPPGNIGDVRASEPLPPETQMTLVAPTQKHRERDTAPPDTQATVVPSSLSRNNRRRPMARKKAFQEPAPQRSVAHNTRSRRLRENEFVQLGTTSTYSASKRSRDPPSKSESGVIYEHVSSVANASHREEVQVEEILQVPEVDDSQGSKGDPKGVKSGSESLGSDSDEAARMLRNANKEMINQGTRSHPQPQDASDARNLGSLPYIDMSREAARTSRNKTVLQPSHMNTRRGDTDTDATPKAKPVMAKRAAKKTAARVTSLEPDDSDLQSGTRSDTTRSSFPAETTIARDYRNAQEPFTPARGTMAEERLRTEKSKLRKGSRGAQ